VHETEKSATKLGMGILTVAGLVQLWHVYVFAFLLGCVTVGHKTPKLES
jgi:hypothetical protein